MKFWSDLVTSFEETLTFVNDMSDFVVFLSDAFGTVPTIFIIFFSLALLFGIAFGFFHLIIEIVVH